MGSPELIEVRDPSCGLDAIIAIHSTALGPAIGGVRTYAYPDREAMVADVTALARAMTVKCSLAGLDAGGGKAVVLDLADAAPGVRVASFLALGVLMMLVAAGYLRVARRPGRGGSGDEPAGVPDDGASVPIG